MAPSYLSVAQDSCCSCCCCSFPGVTQGTWQRLCLSRKQLNSFAAAKEPAEKAQLSPLLSFPLLLSVR